MGPMEERLQRLLEPTVTALGYELLGVEYLSQGKHSRLRLFIDSPDGIGLEDCSKVSHQVSGVLDVEDPIKGQYALEVSSPGLDRPLFTAAQYEKFIGQKVKLRSKLPVDGQRKFTGVINAVEQDDIYIGMENGEELKITCDEIEQAHLVPEI
ncbi:MAG: ribosome maturation factor RimP [Thioalkalispiraceae bacterium]|jgi:ribosome maturation factor RimP